MFRDDTSKNNTLERNGLCTFDMPEYNDEQALIHGAAYGPVAHAYAFAYGRLITTYMSFNASWTLLGLVLVDAGAIPPVYQNRLKLTNGVNCIYAHHTGTNPTSGWQMAVNQPPSSGVCSGGSASLVQSHAEQPSANASDYPVTTRFMEAPGMQPTLGIRCGNVWCIAGANGAADVTPPGYGTLPIGASMKWKVKGWFDDQTLAQGPGPLTPFQRLAIVPADNLGSFVVSDFTAGWKDVAVIIVPAATPTGKYGTTNPGGFALAPGKNTISIQAQTIGGGVLKWQARVTNATYPAGHVYGHDVHWTDHRALGIPIDGTAKWRWMSTDEAVWVRCDVGCCLVYGD
jgi:hypothetical protein